MADVCVAVLGLGEAGSLIARDLHDAAVHVRGYDPAVAAEPLGIDACSDEADAARGADVILSVNSASAAEEALRAGLGGMDSRAVWADLNTTASATKERLAAMAEQAGMVFVDVALMSPVPGKGLRTPMVVSGTGADRYAERMTPLGAQIEVLAGSAGTAATRKLVRSVFFKGLAATVIEALEAARAAGCEDWLRANITNELEQADARTVQRLEDGTYRHAVRRFDEMAAATELLESLEVPARIAPAARDWLAEIMQRRS